jgi:hypothetical protein
MNHEGVSKSFRTGRLEQELQMVQLSATRYSYTATFWVSLVSFAAVTLCVTSQRVFIFIVVMTQSGNFWINPRMVPRKSVPEIWCFKISYCGSSRTVLNLFVYFILDSIKLYDNICVGFFLKKNIPCFTCISWSTFSIFCLQFILKCLCRMLFVTDLTELFMKIGYIALNLRMIVIN